MGRFQHGQAQYDRYYEAWDKSVNYDTYDYWYGKTNYDLLQESKQQTKKLEATVLDLFAG